MKQIGPKNILKFEIFDTFSHLLLFFIFVEIRIKLQMKKVFPGHTVFPHYPQSQYLTYFRGPPARP